MMCLFGKVMLTDDETKLSLDLKVLISSFAGFETFFQNAGFWFLLGRNVVLAPIQMYVPRCVGV